MTVLSSIKHLFPPPEYITLPSAGIDISDTSLKYVRFKKIHAFGTSLSLEKWGDIEVPSDTVTNGNIENPEQMIEVLKKARELIGVDHTRISLPEERAYIFETTVAHDTPFKEIRGLLEFKLEENVPLPLREAIFDYDIVEVDADEKVFRIVVTVYAKETILKYFDVCTAADVTPISFEVEAQAIARSTVPKEKNGTFMVVDFGKTRTGIGIVHKHSLMYTSTVDIGGLAMSAAMRNILGSDVAEEELTKLKNTEGLLGSKKNEAIRSALTELVERIVGELQARIHYWNTRDIDRGKRDIEGVILCGGSSNLAGLPEYLTRRLSVPTTRAEVWNNAFSIDDFVPPITKRYSYGYATAIGLALNDFSLLES